MNWGDRPEKRSGHIAVAFNGHVIVWGGYNDEKLIDPHDIWLYNMYKHKWIKRLDTHGKPPPSPSGSCYAIVGYSLYLFAGFSSTGDINDVYVFDLGSLSWSKCDVTSGKPSTRNKLGCWVYGKKIIFFGGYGLLPSASSIGNGQFLLDEPQYSLLGWNNDLLSYDTEKNEWSALPVNDTTPAPRAAHACVNSDQSTGYLFGGRHLAHRLNDLYSLKFDSCTWTKIVTSGSSPVGRSWHSLSAVGENALFVFGGLTTEGDVMGDSWLFDISKRTWNELSHKQEEVKRWHTACKGIYQGQIILFGGCNSRIDSLEGCEHLNEITIIQLSPLPLLRLALDAVVKYSTETCRSWADLPKELRNDIFRFVTFGG